MFWNKTYYVHEESQKGLNPRCDGYHSVHNLLSSRLLSEDVKIEMYKINILPVVLYGC